MFVCWLLVYEKDKMNEGIEKNELFVEEEKHFLLIK